MNYESMPLKEKLWVNGFPGNYQKDGTIPMAKLIEILGEDLAWEILARYWLSLNEEK